jgi:hypothetical protein
MNGENGIINDDEINGQMNGQMNGGRRRRGSKKRHSKRRGNASLRAWVTFVKKVQREEKVSYKEAMMRAKKRKDNGEKWRGGLVMGGELRGGEEMVDDDKAAIVNDEANLAVDEAVLDVDESVLDDELEGGRRRRRTRRRRVSKKRRNGRKSRRHR